MTFRQDVLKKNLEIVKLQDAQKGKESRLVTEPSSLSPRRRLSSPERKGAQDSLKDFNVEGSLGIHDADEQKEIESLKSKLKAVSRHCIAYSEFSVLCMRESHLVALEKEAVRTPLPDLETEAKSYYCFYQVKHTFKFHWFLITIT